MDPPSHSRATTLSNCASVTSTGTMKVPQFRGAGATTSIGPAGLVKRKRTRKLGNRAGSIGRNVSFQARIGFTTQLMDEPVGLKEPQFTNRGGVVGAGTVVVVVGAIVVVVRCVVVVVGAVVVVVGDAVVVVGGSVAVVTDSVVVVVSSADAWWTRTSSGPSPRSRGAKAADTTNVAAKPPSKADRTLLFMLSLSACSPHPLRPEGPFQNRMALTSDADRPDSPSGGCRAR